MLTKQEAINRLSWNYRSGTYWIIHRQEDNRYYVAHSNPGGNAERYYVHSAPINQQAQVDLVSD